MNLGDQPSDLPPKKEEGLQPKLSSFRSRNTEEKRLQEQKDQINMEVDSYIEDDDSELFFETNIKVSLLA